MLDKNNGVSEWVGLLNEPTKNMIKHICRCQRTVGFEYMDNLAQMLPPDAVEKGYGLRSFLLQPDSFVEQGYADNNKTPPTWSEEVPFLKNYEFERKNVVVAYRIKPEDFEAVARELKV